MKISLLFISAVSAIHMTPSDAAAAILDIPKDERPEKVRILEILQAMEKQEIFSFRESLIPARFQKADDDQLMR